MKSVFIMFAFAAVASAASPECDLWSTRVSSLDIAIAAQKDNLKACQSNCHDTEVLITALEKEQTVTKEFLNDPFFGCTTKK